jgi:hypothetical protein
VTTAVFRFASKATSDEINFPNSGAPAVGGVDGGVGDERARGECVVLVVGAAVVVAASPRREVAAA